MEKIISIKLNKEFKRAYYQGKFKSHPLLVTYIVSNKGKKNRIGITTSKKIGCAVKRNRARRIIKAAYSELVKYSNIDTNGYDFVFVARSDTPLSNKDNIKKIMKKQIEFILRK